MLYVCVGDVMDGVFFKWEEFLFKKIRQKKIHTHTCTLYTICPNSELPLT